MTTPNYREQPDLKCCGNCRFGFQSACSWNLIICNVNPCEIRPIFVNAVCICDKFDPKGEERL